MHVQQGNVSAGALTIEARARNGAPVNGFDELNREPMYGDSIALPLLGVRLITIRTPDDQKK